MKFTKALIKGKLIKRYKRFFVDVKLDKDIITAHCPNTGSMKGLLDEDNEVFVSKNDDPKRKLKYTLEIIKVKKNLVGVNTHFANKIAFHGLSNNLVNVENFLNDFNLDGIILSGGDNIGDDQERDKTENQILNFAIKNKIPLFGVCRGMQVINQYFGGSIIKNNNSSHVGIPHVVNLIHKNIMSILQINSLKVNSFHNNVITTSTLGKNIEPFAITNIDKTVEGFFHKNFPIVGVMWHPERNQDENSVQLLKEIF